MRTGKSENDGKEVRAVTDKQKRFCDEYMIDLNASAAARRAGYSPRFINGNASKLMQITAIRARIDQLMADQSQRTGVNADRIVRELARVAFANTDDVINYDDATIKPDASRDDTAAIASVRVKTIPTKDGEGIEREIKMADKLKALELLGKHQGMFTDKVQLQHEGGIQIVNDIPRKNDKTN